MSSLEKCLFSSLAHFLIGSFIFLKLSCRSCLYIFEISCLSVASFAIIFSHSEGCLFTLLIVSFVVQKLLKRVSRKDLRIVLASIKLHISGFHISIITRKTTIMATTITITSSRLTCLSKWLLLSWWNYSLCIRGQYKKERHPITKILPLSAQYFPFLCHAHKSGASMSLI